jgi:hypothetical protein
MTPAAGGALMTDFQRRVSGDIPAARDRLSAVLPTFRPLSFAVPYGDYGQDASNYAPIAAWEAGWLQTSFAVVFVQDHRVFNPPGERIAQRYGVHATTTAGALPSAPATWCRVLRTSAWRGSPAPRSSDPASCRSARPWRSRGCRAAARIRRRAPRAR